MTTVKEFASLLWERMINRIDCYTYMWANKEAKGYTKPTVPKCGNTPPCPNCNRYGKCVETENLPLYFSDIVEHIQGTKTIAPYQLSTDNTVKYLELDVDSKIGVEAAREPVTNLAQVIIELFGPRSFMVEVSGNKGYHIWIFFGEQIAARFAYALGHYIKNQIEVPEGIEVEVFPKQITEVSYGSTTRLPFGLHKATGQRGLIVDANFEPHKDQYEVFKSIRSISEQELMNVTEKYDIKVPESIRRDSGKGYTAFKCISRLMQEGAQEGNRDLLLYRLACYLRERGFDENMAIMVLEEVNFRSAQPLDQRTVLSKVESAYKADYSGMPCFVEAFDYYCSSSCPIFERKAKWRKTTVEELKKEVRD